jgi:hypothetical protein
MTQTSETIRKDNPQKPLLEEDEVTARAKAAFAEIRAMAERGEFPEMTLDEINEEISNQQAHNSIVLIRFSI